MNYIKDNLVVVFPNFFPIKAKETRAKLKILMHEIHKAEYRYKKLNK